MKRLRNLSADQKLFGLGAMVGITTLSIALASVPRTGRVTDDTAIYDQLSEIRVKRDGKPNFDSDIARLSQMEGRYQEKLPLSQDPRVTGPMKRISQQKYQPQKNAVKKPLTRP